MSHPNAYRVLITTRCRACAIALAFHAPRLGTIRSYHVVEAKEDGTQGFTISAAGAGLTTHDGTPACCPEHGRVLDLRTEPTETPDRRVNEARAAMIASLAETVRFATEAIEALKREQAVGS